MALAQSGVFTSKKVCSVKYPKAVSLDHKNVVFGGKQCSSLEEQKSGGIVHEI
jgi:hypothetical protein